MVAINEEYVRRIRRKCRVHQECPVAHDVTRLSQDKISDQSTSTDDGRPYRVGSIGVHSAGIRHGDADEDFWLFFVSHIFPSTLLHEGER